MPAPTTVAELLDRVRRSGLVPPERLDGFLVGLQSSGRDPATIPELLDRLVDAGMITRFHADRLAAGKYKGFQLGSYLILDQIGSGGMAAGVYLAEHLAMRRLVALKVLPVFAADDAVARERFLREARVAATLDHPNIVRVFDLCQEGKLLYLVMEYVEGISLQALVSRAGPLDVAAACHYARQVAFGLQHAHELGFVHRDIKPANLLLDRAGVVKILDLGLVRSTAEGDAGLTKQLDSRSVLGTADYVAPEQAVDSSGVDIRADLYSLGATLYFLLAGRPLFPEGRTAQKLVWQQIKDPVPIARLRPEVPPGLAEVVHKMLEKRAADRFQTPMDVFEVLAPWAREGIAPPDEALMPTAPARVAVARAAGSGLGPRASGSTSQILALAMQSGAMAGSSPSRPGLGGPGSGGPASDGSGAITPPSRGGLADPLLATDALALDDTRRTPAPHEPAPVDAPRAPWKTIATVAALVAAVVLGIFGIVVLATRG